MMRKYFLLTLGFLLLTLGGLPSVFAEPSVQETLPLGERLVYKITWLRIPVGVGEIWVKEKTTLNGREVYHVVGKIETNKVLSKIFPMHDEAHSWIDVETLESLKFEKVIDELFLDVHEVMTFDSARKKGFFESFTSGKKNEFSVTTPVQDVFSVFYWIRRQNLVPGTPLKTVLCADQKDWTLTINTRGEETVKLNDKKIKTLRVDPDSVVEGVEKRGRSKINLTNDASRKPLRITFKAAFGSVTGTLIGSGGETQLTASTGEA